MSDKYTKGPWEPKGDSNAVGVVVFSQDRIPIAVCNPVSICSGSGAIKRYTGEEAAANAQLIATAPELLEALRDMVSDHKCLSDATLNFARSAIAKATEYDYEDYEA